LKLKVGPVIEIIILQESIAMKFRVLIVFLSFNIIVTAFSGSGGRSESMMNDIFQTMALSMFAYELPKIPEKGISFPRSAPLLLGAAERSLRMDSTICVGKPFNEFNIPDKDISFLRSAPLLFQAAESSLSTDGTIWVGKPFKELNYLSTDKILEYILNDAVNEKESSDHMDSLSIFDDMNDHGRDILEDTQPDKESDEEAMAMKLQDLPNDAGSNKEISDHIDSFSIIANMNVDTQPYKESDQEVTAVKLEYLPNDTGSKSEMSDHKECSSKIIPDMNHYERTQPHKESDEEVMIMKLKDFPNDAGSMKEIIDRIESLANIIHDMNDYQRDIFDNTRVELISISNSQSRVYAILTDEKNKRIFVAFRGTQSPADIHRDAKLIIKNIPDPTSENSSKIIGVHSGFLDALTGGDFDQGKTGKDTYKNGHIAATVKSLGLIEKGYSLYVTGHGLGGAMATLFGFFAASDDYFVKNGSVTIYSYASPRVGDSYFGDAFRVLEMKNRLRHGRIRNSGDVVVRLPYYFGRYKHVGLGVELLRDKPPKFEFPQKSVCDTTKLVFGTKAPVCGAVGDTILNTVLFPFKRMIREHSTNVMFNRLKSWLEVFERTTLEQLYEEFLHPKPSS